MPDNEVILDNKSDTTDTDNIVESCKHSDREFLYIKTRLSKVEGVIIEEDKQMHILDLFVDPKVRMEGVATGLLKQMIHKARTRGLKRVTLDDCLENPNSKLYSNLGFVKLDPSDNEMTLEISPAFDR